MLGDFEYENGLRVRIGQDGLRRALGLAHPAVDALVGMDDEHVVAFVEAVHGTHFHAVHVLALDAVFGDDVSHLSFCRERRTVSGTGLSHVACRRRVSTRFVYRHNAKE